MKRIFIFILILLSFLFVALIGCMFESTNNNINEKPFYEEKIYWKGSIEDDFVEDSVIIALTKEASREMIYNLRTYSIEQDFADIPNLESLTLISKGTLKIAQLQLEAERTGD